MNPLIQSKNTTIRPVLIALTLGCFGLSPQARAVCQEGCLTNFNTVLGEDALLNNTGTYNTAIGNIALQNNTSGDWNTATGQGALYSNTTGAGNTATGQGALYANTTGSFNTACGGALASNTTGDENTATGNGALLLNTTGSHNTATGDLALWHNIGGSNNVALGGWALANNATGNNNIALGYLAGNNLTGNNNIALGHLAGNNLSTGDYNIDIGTGGRPGESNTIRIGKEGTHTAAFIAGISGATVPDGVGVIVGSNGQLGTVVSSERFKDAVKPMNKASEAIHALKPVTFRYKKELDPKGLPQFGLVAEEVAKVDPDLVARDDRGKPYTVRYEAVNAMLLNEFLKEHRKVADQSDQIAELKTTVAELKSALKAQAAQIQKVSDQLKTQVVAPLVVANNLSSD